MPIYPLITLLPFAFALHNLEEILSMEKYTNSIPSGLHKPVTTRQFGIAVALFTLLGFLVVFLKSYYPSEKIYYFFISGFSGMLLLNVFIPHLIATIYYKKYSPGIITALIINLPLTSWILWLIKNSGILTVHQTVISAISGGIIGLALVFVFLNIGKMIDKMMTSA